MPDAGEEGEAGRPQAHGPSIGPPCQPPSSQKTPGGYWWTLFWVRDNAYHHRATVHVLWGQKGREVNATILMRSCCISVFMRRVFCVPPLAGVRPLLWASC